MENQKLAYIRELYETRMVFKDESDKTCYHLMTIKIEEAIKSL